MVLVAHVVNPGHSESAEVGCSFLLSWVDFRNGRFLGMLYSYLYVRWVVTSSHVSPLFLNHGEFDLLNSTIYISLNRVYIYIYYIET